MSDKIDVPTHEYHRTETNTVVIRPTIPADIPALTSNPLPFRIKAWTGLINGRVIGIGGIGFMPDGTVVAFVELSDEARHHKVALHKAALRFMAEVRASGIRELVTVPDAEIERAEPWLRRLGFRLVENNDIKVYRWRTP